MKCDLSIGDTARATGVTEKSLRHWEKVGYIQGIERVICGKRSFRFYSEAQVEQIKAIKNFLDQGYTLSAASAKALQNPEKEDE